MKEHKDILEDTRLKENPFGAPDGYFDSLEKTIGDRIGTDSPTSGTMAVLKPALYLFSMFAVIFGMCYGVLKLTETSKPATSENDEVYLSTVDFILFNRSSLDFLDTDTDSECNGNCDPAEEDLIDFLDTEVSSNQLTSYLLQEQ